MPKQPKKADEKSSPPAVARPCRAGWCSRCPAEMKAARQAERLPKKQSMPHIISLCTGVTAVPLAVKAARSSGVFGVLSDRKACEFLRIFEAVYRAAGWSVFWAVFATPGGWPPALPEHGPRACATYKQHPSSKTISQTK